MTSQDPDPFDLFFDFVMVFIIVIMNASIDNFFN